jgi:pimeloyl-ACP methyl ester carboxylesterase
MQSIELDVRGGRLEAAWWGPEFTPAPPIVLLHDGLGSLSRWRDFPRDLAIATGRRVMAYSRFGHGWSDPARIPRDVDYMHEEAALVPGILAAAGIERAVLFGHSDGGSIALMAAAEHAELVEALVLEAPHLFVEDVSVASVVATTASYADTDLRERLGRYHRDVDLTFGAWSEIWQSEAFRSWNLERYVARTRCPMLLIQGTEDEYGTLAQIEAIAREAPGLVQQLILPECGHSPHKHGRERVLEAVAGFLQRFGA